jgi:2'-5' RNA ligase
VILPPPAVRDHAIELSNELKRYGSKFVLGKRRFMPHISLYHIPVRPADFDAFSEVVAEVASRRRGGELRLSSIDMPLLLTTKPRWLTQLHLSIVKQTIKFFDSSSEHLPSNLRMRAQGAFRPHITLTSFQDRSVAKRIPSPSFEKMSFHVDEVSVCELGPSHSCQRTIARYPLSS